MRIAAAASARRSSGRGASQQWPRRVAAAARQHSAVEGVVTNLPLPITGPLYAVGLVFLLLFIRQGVETTRYNRVSEPSEPPDYHIPVDVFRMRPV